MAEAWNPLYGRVHRVGEPRRDSAAGVKPLRHESGWMVYLAPCLARHVTPPPGIAYETHPDGHLLMIATPDQFDPSNPAHQAAVEAIEAALSPIQSIAYY